MSFLKGKQIATGVDMETSDELLAKYVSAT